MIKFFLEHGANPNIIGSVNFGETPLSMAIKGFQYNPHYWEVIKLLLYHRANPYVKNHEGKNSLEIAQELFAERSGLLLKAQQLLINKLTALLSRGKSPFNPDVAYK